MSLAVAPHARAPQATAATPAAAPEYGPAKGTLLLVGGNMSDNFGVPQAFIQLAGGPAKKFVIVPTNGGNRNADGTPKVYKEEAVVAGWKRRGLSNVVMLRTWDAKVADTGATIEGDYLVRGDTSGPM